jgi:YidC/Oxa1 family membrane protein insertase
LPVFFALFFVLRDFAENPPGGDLSFLGSFVPDITEKTSEAGAAGVVLIVVYVASQVLSTLLMPSTMPKEQRYIFLALPFVFVLFVVNFPIGLMLYWITTNLWTVGQAAVIRHIFPPPAFVEMQALAKEKKKGDPPPAAAKREPKPKPEATKPTAAPAKPKPKPQTPRAGQPRKTRRPPKPQPKPRGQTDE